MLRSDFNESLELEHVTYNQFMINICNPIKVLKHY